jgi:hypothetical protein
VARVDDVELAVRQPLVQESGVDRRHFGIVGAGDDLHRGVYPRQQASQYRKLNRVGPQVTNRLGEPVSLVGGQVVVPD